MKRNLSVRPIQNGTVIDHIQVGQGLKIMALLGEFPEQVTVGLNLKSSLLGSKDLIKIEGLFLTEAQTSQIALFSPQATVNVIRKTKIITKYKVRLPEQIQGLLHCPNQLCITNFDPVITRFSIYETPVGVFLRCHFCEKIYNREYHTQHKT